MLSKLIILTFMLAILACLGSAVYFLIKQKPGSSDLVKALTARIGLSLLLFALLMLFFALGWISPHPI